jgi:Short C-terminal domain
MEAGQVQVGVRAAVHALDAALAEHRRAVTLAAGSRERERMARGRAVKAAAAASEEALEQPVERPLRGLRLAETWIEVNRVRHPLTDAVRARTDGAELRVSGDGWSARLVLPPGDGPAEAARAAAARVEAAASAAVEAAGSRLRLVTETARAEAAARHDAATALAAADRRIAELHADQALTEACAADLADRLGPRRPGEAAEVEAARARLEQARLFLDAPPDQPHAWIEGWPPGAAGAMLRDLPDESRVEAEPAVRRLLAELREDEPLLALAATDDGVAAATPRRVLSATGAATAAGDPDVAAHERRAGRLAAVVELVRAAGPREEPDAPPSATAADDPVELLRRLGELRDRGVLSADEFEAKKAELLRRI